MFSQVKTLGEENPFTKLVVDLTGVDPDDAFSTCPYEKGHTFLFYLEQLLGGSGRKFFDNIKQNSKEFERVEDVYKL